MESVHTGANSEAVTVDYTVDLIDHLAADFESQKAEERKNTLEVALRSVGKLAWEWQQTGLKNIALPAISKLPDRSLVELEGMFIGQPYDEMPDNSALTLYWAALNDEIEARGLVEVEGYQE